MKHKRFRVCIYIFYQSLQIKHFVSFCTSLLITYEALKRCFDISNIGDYGSESFP